MVRTITVRSGIIGSGRAPLVCVPIVSRTRAAICAELETVAGKRPDIIEWRADFYDGIADAAGVLGLAQQLRDRAGGIPVLFTVRSEYEGGAASLSDPATASLLVDVCNAGAVELVDFEMRAGAEHIRRVRSAARDSGTQLILSQHDFRATPDAATVYEAFARAHELGADIAKVAVMPHSPEDVLTLLGATLKAHRALELPLIGISMGAYGVLTRVFGWQFGSSVSFAEGEAGSAPGQLPIEDLQAALRILRREFAAR